MMRRLLCFLHISSLLCRTTVCSLAIGGILLSRCVYYDLFILCFKDTNKFFLILHLVTTNTLSLWNLLYCCQNITPKNIILLQLLCQRLHLLLHLLDMFPVQPRCCLRGFLP